MSTKKCIPKDDRWNVGNPMNQQRKWWLEYYEKLFNLLTLKTVRQLSIVHVVHLGKLIKGVRFLHDNAPVYTAAKSQAAIHECGFHELEYQSFGLEATSKALLRMYFLN